MLAKAKKNLGHLADKKVEAFLELADKEHDKILKEKQKFPKDTSQKLTCAWL